MPERKCAKCGEVRNWRRYRVSLGKGRMRDEAICSTCRRARRKGVLNRTQKQELKRVAKEVKKVRSYCNLKTNKDRKYLRDNPEPNKALPQFQYDQQVVAIHQANNWINFYSDISKHVINILQITGTSLSLTQLESDPHLQRTHGVYDTKRAQRLRYNGQSTSAQPQSKLSCI